MEQGDSKGKIGLYYADESHVCTDGYVPYGWQFKDEHVYIPSAKAARLNTFGMITRRNQYKGFRAQESINADKLVDFLDRFYSAIQIHDPPASYLLPILKTESTYP
ncbi:transposase [Phocaeicola barnesiae]|uniref:transposase n=1 Tax=Phocaeicola barnesiae TaxID=376804 RepID=UPI003364EF61